MTVDHRTLIRVLHPSLCEDSLYAVYIKEFMQGRSNINYYIKALGQTYIWFSALKAQTMHILMLSACQSWQGLELSILIDN